MVANRLLDVSSHFAFGESWANYARDITPERIEAAEAGLKRLLGDIRGKTFLDIGCGSGIHATAAARLGASKVVATDLDPVCIETCQRVASQYAPGSRVDARVSSVFDLPADMFDIVYSWGVLHHTGDMYAAIDRAASLVAPRGRFVISIYGKTPLCGFWRVEKRFYSASPRPVQAVLRGLYRAMFLAVGTLRGWNPAKYIREYNDRGMTWKANVHDWLGGYPYESATIEEITRHVSRLGFSAERVLPQPTGIGLLGTGCHEYVFRKL